MVQSLDAEDIVLFLVSGGGSSLFEIQINAVRKHLSKVKGGRFAQVVSPAKIFSLVLSDVLGNKLDAIASGPAYPDNTTTQQAVSVIQKYRIKMSSVALHALSIETPKYLDNVETKIIGSVSIACDAAKYVAEKLGYNALVLTTTLNCHACEAGVFLSAIAQEIASSNQPIKKPCVIIVGGETVVHVKGSGFGGRNQELALSAAIGIEGLDNVVIVSVATDGIDGPTEAAGGIVDGTSIARLTEKGISAIDILSNNDSYHGLKLVGDQIIIGPTGTNVNDLTLILCR